MAHTNVPDPTRATGARNDTARPSTPIVLWTLRGATDDLRGLAVETSFGYALELELDSEVVLRHLQPSLDVLVTYADRIETALLAQGWQRIPERDRSHKECA